MISRLARGAACAALAALVGGIPAVSAAPATPAVSPAPVPAAAPGTAAPATASSAAAAAATPAAVAPGAASRDAAAPAAAAAQADASVTRATLPNGLRVVVVRDPLAPVVTEIVNYLVGAADAPKAFPGIAHAEEHMVAGRSTREIDANQMATITALLGGDFNADTQESTTQYYLTTPAAYLDTALHVEAARMRDTLDLQKEWANERGAIDQEVSADESSAFQRYNDKALARLFAGTPYDHTPLGTRASFGKLTGADLKAFFTTWYAPNNAILVISGDVDPQTTLAHVRSIFGGIPRRPVPAHAPVAPRPLRDNAVIRDTSDFSVPIVVLTYRMPGVRDPDYAATQIAVDALASQRGALAALTFEGKALGADFSYSPFERAGFGYAYIATAPGADVGAARSLLASTVGGVVSNGIAPELVEAAKQREIAQELFARNSIDGLAQDWSQALAVAGVSSPSDQIEQIRAVTADQVNAALRTYLQPQLAVVGVLTPKAGAASGGSSSVAVKDSFSSKDAKPVALPAWAAKLSELPAVPTSNVAPVDATLPNGIRLIVQPEHVSPTVSLVGAIDQNAALQVPAGKEGVDGVLDGLYAYGTTTYDRLAFQRELDAIAASVSAGTSFSASAPAEHFDRAVALLADDLLHPALPQPAFDIVRGEAVQSLAGEVGTPPYLSQRALLGALLPAGDPGLRTPTAATLGSLTLDDVRAYRSTVVRPDETTIVVSGDIAPDAARAVVERYFGGWTATGAKPKTDLDPIPRSGPAARNVAAPGRTQTTVTLAEELGGLTRTSPDYDALQLGDAILGGAFYSTRFSRDLRENAGLVYSIDVGVRAGKTRSVYDVDFGSDPANVGRARAIVDRELRTIAAAPPSQTELRQAKVQLLRDLDLSEASVDAIAGGLASRSVAGLPLDEPTRRARRILAIDGPAVSAAFARWVKPASFAQIDVGPKP